MCLKHTYFYQNLVSNNDCSTTILPTQNFSFDLSLNSFWNLVIRMLALLWSIFPAHASLFPCFLSVCVYISSRSNICNCVQAFYLPRNCVQVWSLALQFPAHQCCQRFKAPRLNCKTTATANAVTTSSLKQKSQKLNDMNQKFESYSLRSTSQSFIWCPSQLAVCSMQFATFHAKYFELSPNPLARCPPSVTETSSKRLKGWKAAKERRLLYNRSHRVPLWAWFARWISWMPAIHGFGESVKRVVVYLCVFVQDRTPGRGPAPAAFYTDLPPPVKDSSCSDCGSVQSPLSQQCQPLIHQAAAHSLGRSLHVGPLIHSPPVLPCNPRRVLSSRHLPFFSTTCNLLMTHSAIALNDRDDVDNGKVYVCGKAGIVVCLIWQCVHRGGELGWSVVEQG